ncbi:class I SAM-dependent methyltransferase [Herbidospora mongoliensis]|uniref:class I SAM-dependent methyltransferase n=1 Tax=Herbidospora mongoliensis TaxID=688067 RepID=UPI00083323A7|nr:class I SAM-dependent methyltransferase [Herbidospora mongoliensis]
MTDVWRHNSHYHRLLLKAMPPNCGSALDIGCGSGLLTRKIAERCPDVTGIDRSAEMIRQATETGGGAKYVQTDIHDWAEGPYDFVTSVAVIHHMDFETGLKAHADLVRPGGTLAVLGLARDDVPKDLPLALTGMACSFVLNWINNGSPRYPPEQPGMPMIMPELTWAQVRERTRKVLPGAVFRRHLLWRYSIIFTKAIE